MNERIFIDMITLSCQRQGIELMSWSDGWLLELKKGNDIRRILGSNFDLNTQAAAATARDKAATSALLKAADISHVAHAVLRSSNAHVMDEKLLATFLEAGDVVIKPLEGGKGDLITRVATVEAARKCVDGELSTAWALSPFIDISREVRLVIVDDEIRVAYAKTDPVVVNGLKFFNLNKGAKAEPLDMLHIPIELCDLALAAARRLGLHMAAVDLVITNEKQVSVLEVNAAFSLMHYAQTNKATYEQVALFYDRLIADMFAIT